MLPWPPPSPPCTGCKLNHNFTPLFQRLVYAVVRDANTTDHIPAYLEPFFAAKTANPAGYICTDPTALSDLAAYGFLRVSASRGRPGALLAVSQCGVSHWRYSRPAG
jgi:hypothetical protein